VSERAVDGYAGKPGGTADGEIAVHLGHEHGVTSGQGLATSWRRPTSTLAECAVVSTAAWRKTAPIDGRETPWRSIGVAAAWRRTCAP
jgi:hypothetical protein